MKKSQLKSLIKAIIKESMDDVGGTNHDIVITTKGFFGRNEEAFFRDLLMFDVRFDDKAEYKILRQHKLPNGNVEWTINIEMPPNSNFQVIKGKIEKNPHVVSVKFQGIDEDHGLGFSHNATTDTSDVQLTRDQLNDPVLTGKKPFKEGWYSNQDLKVQDIQKYPDRLSGVQYNEALFKIWEWTRSGGVNQKEFKQLIDALMKKAVSIKL
jgi:hypothetical protein